METAQWVGCVLLPTTIALLAGLAAWWLERWRACLPAATLVMSLGWAAAVFVGLLGYRRWSGDESPLSWPADFWQRGYWAMAVMALFMPATLVSATRAPATRRGRACPAGGWPRRCDGTLRWVLAAVLMFAAAAIALPGGTGWEDTYPLHRTWLVWLGGWGLLSLWSLERLAVSGSNRARDVGCGDPRHGDPRHGDPGHGDPSCGDEEAGGWVWRGTERWWSLVLMIWLGGLAYVAATTYSALLVWAAAGLAATAVGALWGLAVGLRSTLGMAYPAVAWAIGLFSAGRFYSYEDHPLLSYLGMTAVVPLVGLVDQALVGCLRLRSQFVRAVLAGVLASALVGWSAFRQGVMDVFRQGGMDQGW